MPLLPSSFLMVTSMMVHPGKTYSTGYIATNNKGVSLVGQAVPSLAPAQASTYFNKTECFCFERQVLSAGERIELPVRFIIDPALPKEIGSLSLGYTLFDITDRVQPENEIVKL